MQRNESREIVGLFLDVFVADAAAIRSKPLEISRQSFLQSLFARFFTLCAMAARKPRWVVWRMGWEFLSDGRAESPMNLLP